MGDKIKYVLVKDKGVRHHYFIWKNAPIPVRAYRGILAEYNQSPDYRAEDEGIISRAVTLSGRLGVSPQQCLNLRRQIIRQKAINAQPRMNRMIAQLTEEFDGGTHILDISRKYDLPPLNLMRGILLHKKYNSSDIYAIFALRMPPDRLLGGRLLEEFEAAMAADADSITNQQEAARLAAEDELALVKMFRDLGINLATQADISAKQVAEHGRAVATPDILFEEPVYINNRRINYIEFKSYVGAPTHHLHSKNQQQMLRYRDMFGYGAICFKLGFIEGYRCGDAYVIDGTAISRLWEAA